MTRAERQKLEDLHERVSMAIRPGIEHGWTTHDIASTASREVLAAMREAAVASGERYVADYIDTFARKHRIALVDDA